MPLLKEASPKPRWVHWVFAIAGAAAILILMIGIGAYLKLRLSLPRLEGTVTATELSAPVTVTRDAQGVPTLTGQTRTDLAWVLGYLHAQERFFQMDGQRRMAAGELAGLAGAALLSQDRERRVHRFRHRARAVLAAMSPEERKVLDAYVAGVNRGLSSLETAPFEYMLLRSTPAPWTAEDTVLTVYAMYLDLQEADGATELRRAIAEEALGQPLATFLFPEGTLWDAPLDGSSLPLPAMPDSRAAKRADNLIPTAEDEVEVASPGSNSWAVGGALSTRGAAIVANDMHLSLRVPNIWYRAKLVQNDRDGATILNITGATLPGAPNLVAGSNGKIAWGFTNSFADASDVVILEPAGEDPNLYRTPAGPPAFCSCGGAVVPQGCRLRELAH